MLLNVEMPVNTQTALLCAATRWEALPLVRAFEGNAAIRVLQTGIGKTKCAAALSSAASPSLVVSTGYAGALQPGMKPGELVADVREADLELVKLARELAQSMSLPIHFGKIVHSDRVLGKAADKRALGARERASAVDMESLAIRDWARPLGVPVLVVRAVLDSVDDSLPEQVPGDEDLPALISYALSHPLELPRLMKLGLRQRRVMPRYARFLARFVPEALARL